MAEFEEKIICRLEALSETDARSAIIKGDFGDSPSHPVRRVADAWLAAKDSARRDAREERTLSIARLASRWALWANIIAITAIVIAIKDHILALLFRQP